MNSILDFIKIITLWLRITIHLLLMAMIMAILLSPVLIFPASFYFSMKEDDYKLEAKCQQETLAQRPKASLEEIAKFCEK